MRARAEGHHVIRAARTDAALEAVSRDAVGWVLLLFFDAGGDQHSLRKLLRAATVTYVVMRLTTRGAALLRREQYKVQLLSASHLVPSFVPNTLLDGGGARRLHGALKALGGRAYVFATQGLDLAIPDRREYIRPCPQTGDMRPALRWTTGGAAAPVCVPRNNATASAAAARPAAVSELWHSHTTPALAEAACARVRCTAGAPPAAVCRTRIVQKAAASGVPRAANAGEPPPPSLLVLLIDPISRRLFSRALPRTRAVLAARGFASFDAYAVVGANVRRAGARNPGPAGRQIGAEAFHSRVPAPEVATVRAESGRTVPGRRARRAQRERAARLGRVAVGRAAPRSWSRGALHPVC